MQNDTKKLRYLLLGITLVLIIAGILYLESQKADYSSTDDTIPAPFGVEITEESVASSTGIIADPSTDPEIKGIAAWINAEPLTLAKLKGNVVLIDFWTYSCINCIRTLPYINAWDEKYRDDGLVIVGIHTPEFNFEKELVNVQAAVDKYGINHPVGLDNDKATWRSFQNRYWPRKYLFDIDGNLVYDHIGEGGYDETEKKIQELLMERAERLDVDAEFEKSVVNPDAVAITGQVGTPEIYFGYEFTRGNFGNPQGLPPEETVEYSLPEQLVFNQAYLEGTWKITADYAELVSSTGTVVLPYQARVLNIVAGSDPASRGTVFVDDIAAASNAGADVSDGIVMFSDEQLYHLVDEKGYGQHLFRLDVTGSGFRIYTFTFG